MTDEELTKTAINHPERVQREQSTKQLQVCRACGGYMKLQNAIASGHGRRRHYRDDTYLRSFGGVRVRTFVCEKCQRVETFQNDDLTHLLADPYLGF